MCLLFPLLHLDPPYASNFMFPFLKKKEEKNNNNKKIRKHNTIQYYTILYNYNTVQVYTILYKYNTVLYNRFSVNQKPHGSSWTTIQTSHLKGMDSSHSGVLLSAHFNAYVSLVQSAAFFSVIFFLLKIYLLLNYVCVWGGGWVCFSEFIYMPYVHAWYLQKPEEESRVPETGVKDSYKLTRGCWELNSSSLKE